MSILKHSQCHMFNLLNLISTLKFLLFLSLDSSSPCHGFGRSTHFFERWNHEQSNKEKETTKTLAQSGKLGQPTSHTYSILNDPHAKAFNAALKSIRRLSDTQGSEPDDHGPTSGISIEDKVANFHRSHSAGSETEEAMKLADSEVSVAISVPSSENGDCCEPEAELGVDDHKGAELGVDNRKGSSSTSCTTASLATGTRSLKTTEGSTSSYFDSFSQSRSTSKQVEESAQLSASQSLDQNVSFDDDDHGHDAARTEQSPAESRTGLGSSQSLLLGSAEPVALGGGGREVTRDGKSLFPNQSDSQLTLTLNHNDTEPPPEVTPEAHGCDGIESSGKQAQPPVILDAVDIPVPVTDSSVSNSQSENQSSDATSTVERGDREADPSNSDPNKSKSQTNIVRTKSDPLYHHPSALSQKPACAALDSTVSLTESLSLSDCLTPMATHGEIFSPKDLIQSAPGIGSSTGLSWHPSNLAPKSSFNAENRKLQTITGSANLNFRSKQPAPINTGASEASESTPDSSYDTILEQGGSQGSNESGTATDNHCQQASATVTVVPKVAADSGPKLPIATGPKVVVDHKTTKPTSFEDLFNDGRRTALGSAAELPSPRRSGTGRDKRFSNSESDSPASLTVGGGATQSRTPMSMRNQSHSDTRTVTVAKFGPDASPGQPSQLGKTPQDAENKAFQLFNRRVKDSEIQSSSAAGPTSGSQTQSADLTEQFHLRLGEFCGASPGSNSISSSTPSQPLQHPQPMVDTSGQIGMWVNMMTCPSGASSGAAVGPDSQTHSHSNQFLQIGTPMATGSTSFDFGFHRHPSQSQTLESTNAVLELHDGDSSAGLSQSFSYFQESDHHLNQPDSVYDDHEQVPSSTPGFLNRFPNGPESQNLMHAQSLTPQNQMQSPQMQPPQMQQQSPQNIQAQPQLQLSPQAHQHPPHQHPPFQPTFPLSFATPKALPGPDPSKLLHIPLDISIALSEQLSHEMDYPEIERSLICIGRVLESERRRNGGVYQPSTGSSSYDPVDFTYSATSLGLNEASVMRMQEVLHQAKMMKMGREYGVGLMVDSIQSIQNQHGQQLQGQHGQGVQNQQGQGFQNPHLQNQPSQIQFGNQMPMGISMQVHHPPPHVNQAREAALQRDQERLNAATMRRLQQSVTAATCQYDSHSESFQLFENQGIPESQTVAQSYPFQFDHYDSGPSQTYSPARDTGYNYERENARFNPLGEASEVSLGALASGSWDHRSPGASSCCITAGEPYVNDYEQYPEAVHSQGEYYSNGQDQAGNQFDYSEMQQWQNTYAAQVPAEFQQSNYSMGDSGYDTQFATVPDMATMAVPIQASDPSNTVTGTMISPDGTVLRPDGTVLGGIGFPVSNNAMTNCSYNFPVSQEGVEMTNCSYNFPVSQEGVEQFTQNQMQIQTMCVPLTAADIQQFFPQMMPMSSLTEVAVPMGMMTLGANNTGSVGVTDQFQNYGQNQVQLQPQVQGQEWQPQSQNHIQSVQSDFSMGGTANTATMSNPMQQKQQQGPGFGTETGYSQVPYDSSYDSSYGFQPDALSGNTQSGFAENLAYGAGHFNAYGNDYAQTVNSGGATY